MNKFSKMISAAALAIAVTAGVSVMSVSAQTAGSNPPPTRVATINIVRVFDSLNEKKGADADLELLGKRLDDKRKQLEQELERLRQELKDYKPDSDVFKETQENMLKKAMELRSQSEYMEQKLQLEQRLRTGQVYRHIVASIEAYSKQSGIIMVLVADEIDITGSRTQAELLTKIAMRKVVYAHESLDITKAVIEKMNSEFKLGK